jgi:hypothetical protein
MATSQKAAKSAHPRLHARAAPPSARRDALCDVFAGRRRYFRSESRWISPFWVTLDLPGLNSVPLVYIGRAQLTTVALLQHGADPLQVRNPQRRLRRNTMPFTLDSA